jgi:REP element-mobilizing transposase RayT
MEPNDAPYPILRFLNEFSEIGKTRNRLPHWNQEQATCFITFRLGDSIPEDALKTWRMEKERWLMDHPKPWTGEEEKEYHGKFSVRIDRYLDQGHGSCVLADDTNAAIMAEAFRHFDQSRYLLHAWVIMPNHVHLLLTLRETESLARIVASWKRFTALRIRRQMQSDGPLWQKDYFDRIIRDWDHFVNVARYIRRNPAKANLREGSYLLEEAAWIKRLLG